MIQIDNHLGTITISLEYLTDLVAHTVQGCFGVAGMASADAVESLRLFVGRRSARYSRGVKVRSGPKGLTLDLHIVVLYGASIPAISKSIVHEVKYTVENATGISVAQVNVFVDNVIGGVNESEG